MRLSKRILAAVGLSIITVLSLAIPASAHVVVRPAEAVVGGYQTFSVSAPNEKDIAFTSVKVLIPAGVLSVMPTAKQGWTISTEKTGEGEAMVVTSITWSEGSVPGGQRDEFSFSAKMPDKATSLDWKAYQTYQDGTVVAWDKKETADGHGSEDENSGPSSLTVVQDKSTADQTAESLLEKSQDAKSKANLAFLLAVAALIGNLVVIGFRSKK